VCVRFIELVLCSLTICVHVCTCVQLDYVGVLGYGLVFFLAMWITIKACIAGLPWIDVDGGMPIVGFGNLGKPSICPSISTSFHPALLASVCLLRVTHRRRPSMQASAGLSILAPFALVAAHSGHTCAILTAGAFAQQLSTFNYCFYIQVVMMPMVTPSPHNCWNEVPINGCQIGAKCPILHAKQDQVYPIGFSDAPFSAVFPCSSWRQGGTVDRSKFCKPACHHVLPIPMWQSRCSDAKTRQRCKSLRGCSIEYHCASGGSSSRCQLRHETRTCQR
jgi:hypothetical protein